MFGKYKKVKALPWYEQSCSFFYIILFYIIQKVLLSFAIFANLWQLTRDIFCAINA